MRLFGLTGLFCVLSKKCSVTDFLTGYFLVLCYADTAKIN